MSIFVIEINVSFEQLNLVLPLHVLTMIFNNNQVNC